MRIISKVFEDYLDIVEPTTTTATTTSSEFMSNGENIYMKFSSSDTS